MVIETMPATITRKLSQVEKRRQAAAQNLHAVEQEYIDLQVRRTLDKDEQWAQFDKKEQAIRRGLHDARLNITKKTGGLKIRIQQAKEMRAALADHIKERDRLEAEEKVLEQARDARRREVERNIRDSIQHSQAAPHPGQNAA
jgi:hypothetical protein